MTTITQSDSPTSPPPVAADELRWHPVCRVDQVPDRGGVAALVDDHPVALFSIDGDFWCLDLIDPVSGAPVLNRGILGGDHERRWVASPMYKERFDLATGACLDDDSVSVRVWAVRVADDEISVAM